jgi:hypothetical protein
LTITPPVDECALDADGGLCLSLSLLAELRGMTTQAISQQLARFRLAPEAEADSPHFCFSRRSRSAHQRHRAPRREKSKASQLCPPFLRPKISRIQFDAAEGPAPAAPWKIASGSHVPALWNVPIYRFVGT